MSWYDEMVAAGTSKSLTTGNVRCPNVCVCVFECCLYICICFYPSNPATGRKKPNKYVVTKQKIYKQLKKKLMDTRKGLKILDISECLWCTLQVWQTVRCCHSWREDIVIHSQQPVHQRCMRSCCHAGRSRRKNDRHSTICFTQWMTTMLQWLDSMRSVRF